MDIKITEEYSDFEVRGLILYTAQQNKRALERTGRNTALVDVFYTGALGSNDLEAGSRFWDI